MTLRLWRGGSTKFVEQSAVNLDREPSPVIMAAGIGGVCIRGWQYWIEDDGVERYRPDQRKPSYRVPSMDEIRAIPWNGLTAISTFSGCGGSSLGYRMAGYRVLWASEFVDAARESYVANKADYTIVDSRDIRTVEPDDILSAIGLKVGELDLLDGSPPCASFSTAGKREKHWGQIKKYSDTKQRTDDLFFEFARILRGLQPRTFVAENVSGLVKGTAKGYFVDILRALKACGYRVEARKLDAQWLGVPQMRQRVIFIGVREGLGLAPAFPKPLPYRYSVRDALPNIRRHETAPPHAEFVAADRDIEATMVSSAYNPCPTITTGENKGAGYVEAFPPGVALIGNHSYRETTVPPTEPAPMILAACGMSSGMVAVEPESDISRYAIGDEWDKLKPGEQSDRYFNLVKPALNEPSPAITAAGATLSAASVVHPLEKRKLTIAELRRICSFPDDFVLTGTYGQMWERLGRAVPPLMMRHIAEAIRDGVLLPLKARAA